MGWAHNSRSATEVGNPAVRNHPPNHPPRTDSYREGRSHTPLLHRLRNNSYTRMENSRNMHIPEVEEEEVVAGGEDECACNRENEILFSENEWGSR